MEDAAVTEWFAAPSLRASAELAERLVAGDPGADVDVRAAGVLVTGGRVAGGDPTGVQRLGVVLEAADPGAAAGFWGPVLGRPDLADPFRRDPAFRVVPSTEHRPLRQRVHLDVVRPAGVVERLGLGEAGGPYGVRHADPEGNELVIRAG